jgi:23S rRNA (cytidine1920-2'-O)/16S rRNA (cytidine1409-2'-O)-methyltransferase
MTTPGPNRQENSRKKKATQRLDLLLVQRGMSESREQARRLIMAGEVTVAGEVCDKPGKPVPADAEVAVKRPPRFVSRGGLKLEAALAGFGLDVAGLVAVDVGASTGGFTDCLLQRGAARVYAIDVGYGQLAWKLQTDPRVVVLDRTNVRHLEHLPEGTLADLAVIDASFISLALVLPATLRLIKPTGQIVALVKPQFEAGRGDVGKGGVVRDPRVHRRVLDETVALAQELRLTVAGITVSPAPGPAGNVEFLLWLRRRSPDEADSAVPETGEMIAAALESAHHLRRAAETQ